MKNCENCSNVLFQYEEELNKGLCDMCVEDKQYWDELLSLPENHYARIEAEYCIALCN